MHFQMAPRYYKTKCRLCKQYKMTRSGFSYCFDCWNKSRTAQVDEKKQELKATKKAAAKKAAAKKSSKKPAKKAAKK